MPHSESNPDLQSLFDAVLRDRAEAEEFRKLEAMLDADAEVRDALPVMPSLMAN